jgi:hypothetical protein
MSYNEVARIIGKEIGKTVRTHRVPTEDAVPQLAELLGYSQEIPIFTQDAIQRLILYYDHHGLTGSSNVLEWLLEKKGTSYEEWVKQEIATLKV